MTATTYDYTALRDFAATLGEKVGLAQDRARTQAEVLLEADLMGHTTHGLAMLPGFLKSIDIGATRATGEPKVLSDHGSTLLWDAETLPGTWILCRAIAEARQRLAQHPVVTVVLRNTAHIAALGAYLRRATDHGLVIMIMNSDPSMRTVAPAGGREAQLAPNPLAFGYPTETEPVLIDISTSSVANGWVRRWSAEKRKLPGKWLLDHAGNATDEPGALFGTDRGSAHGGLVGNRPRRQTCRRRLTGVSSTPRSQGVCRRGRAQARGQLVGGRLPPQSAAPGSGGRAHAWRYVARQAPGAACFRRGALPIDHAGPEGLGGPVQRYRTGAAQLTRRIRWQAKRDQVHSAAYQYLL
jgi:hypothetical protein